MLRSRIIRFLCCFALWACRPVQATPIPTNDDAFLEDLEHRSFNFFWELGNPETGLMPNRAYADGSANSGITSIAVIGFGLTSYCIGVERGWVPRAQAEARVEATLKFLLANTPEEHGFLPHFLDLKTGKRAWNSEFSSIDTALLMHGVLTARQYFSGPRVTPLATKIYERIDWPWMMNGKATLGMGWKPESGFLPWHWEKFSEHLGMTLLAMASPTHPLPADTWKAWQRGPFATFEGKKFVQYPPLFVHQFPQAWWDFRGWRDGELEYFSNSRTATLAQRAFCVSLKDKFPGYDENTWGLTSSDSAKGYTDWGGPPIDGGKINPRIDGSVVPCAAAGSLPFAPRECLAALKTMRERFGDRIYGRFGFADAFHPTNGWTNRDVLGLDVGITLVMAENYRTGFVWKWFAKNPEVSKAMALAGFQRCAVASGETTH